MARTVVISVLSVAGAVSVATPVGVYFNTKPNVRYVDKSGKADIGYGQPTPSPPSMGDQYIAAILSNNYTPGLAVGTPNVQVVFAYSPRKGFDLPSIRYRLSLNVVKGMAVARDIAITANAPAGSTSFPLLSADQLPDPPVGFKRPWSAPAFTYTPPGTTAPAELKETTLPRLRAGTSFTAVYTADVDDANYVQTEGLVTKFTVTYTLV